METPETTSIAQRISELMFRLNKNQSTFAEAIGVSQPTVRNIIKDVTKPRYELLQSILKAYPNINKDWLIEGKGEMFLDAAPSEPVKIEPSNDAAYLLEALKKIEESFKYNIEEKDRVIADQRFIIDTLKTQVAALSSVNGGFLDPNTGEPKMNLLKGDYELKEEIRA